MKWCQLGYNTGLIGRREWVLLEKLLGIFLTPVERGMFAESGVLRSLILEVAF